MESDSLKLARRLLGARVDLTIDRSVGSRHPKHDYLYEVNYGFVDGIKASDGEDLDAYYLGVKTPLSKVQGICIAIVHREDDDDDKLIVVPEGTVLSDAEILSQIHFQEQWFDCHIIRA